jgi:Tol biopolymer transport system component
MNVERLLWTGALTVTLAVILFGWFNRSGVTDAPRIPVRFTVLPPDSMVIEMTTASPDGQTIAFTATGGGNSRLWIRPMKSLAPQSLPGTENAQFPFWSPDSRFLGFFSEGKLKKIDVTGGIPLVVCDAPDPIGGTWNAAGEILFGSLSGGLFRTSSGGGIPSQLTALDSAMKETSHSWPKFLPDGRHYLYTSVRVFDEEVTTYLTSLDDTSRTALITSDANAIFAAPSSILFLRNRTLMVQALDLGKKRLTGDPSPVKVDVGRIPRFAAGDFSYSPAGVLTTGTGRSVNRQYAWFDRSGNNLGAASPPGNYFDIALSPAGDHAAVQKVDVQTGNSDIWILDLTRGLVSRFTFDPAVDDDPIWTPDGGFVYFSNASGKTYNIYRKTAGGGGHAEMVLKPGSPQIPNDWSKDGKHLLYEVIDQATGSDIWIMPSDTNSPPTTFIATPFNEYAAQFSPDGKWVAYTSNESGRSEVYVRSFPAAGGRWQVSSNGGARPRWRPDGRELFYVAPNLDLMSVEVMPGSTFEYGVAKKLFTTKIDNYIGPNRYVVSRDGSKFLINIPLDDERENNVTVSINPFEM